MKKTLFILLATLGFISCSTSDDPTNETTTTPKEYVISLGFSGEITSIEDTPLTKAVSNNLYGIQVYLMPTNGTEYQPYAYGLFDDISNITIKLLEGYKYKFACTMVTDGKSKIAHSSNDGYDFPFLLFGEHGSGPTLIIENKLISSKYEISSIDNGSSGLAVDREVYNRPNIDRYYGAIADYIPVENSSVSIDMKRVSFGVKIIADGLTEGSLNISLDKAPSMTITYPNTSVQDIFTFSNTYPYGMTWTQDGYTEKVSMTISWTKADGAVVPLVTQDITFTRNKLTTITVKVKDNSINNGVDISQESASMGDGGSVTIDTSNSDDTTVTPG
jgi:hypothetical protein